MSATDIRALVLIDRGPATNGMVFAPAPLALLDVAGMSPFERFAERLRRQGISPVTAVIEWSPGYPHRSFPLPSEIDCRTTPSDRFWRAGESAFNDLAQSGAELVMVIRLAHLPKDLAIPVCLQGHAAFERALSQEGFIGDLPIVKESALLGEIAI